MTAQENANVRIKLLNALGSLVPGGEADIVVQKIIDSLHDGGVDLSSDKSDLAVAMKALTLLRPFVFTPEDPDAMKKIGYSTQPNLPITALSILLKSIGDDLRINWAPNLSTILMPHLTAIGGRLYLNVPATVLAAPNLVSIGENLIIDWLNGPLVLESLETIGGQVICNPGGDAGFTSISLPRLRTTDGGSIFQLSASTVNSLLLPALESAGTIDISNLAIPSILLSSLTTAYALSFTFCLSLTTVSIPVYVPANGSTVTFAENALNAASVNHILARCVANPAYVTGQVFLQGGSNAIPTGQGLTDVTTLTNRGVSVTVNS